MMVGSVDRRAFRRVDDDTAENTTRSRRRYLVSSRRAVPRDAQVVEPTTATLRREGLRLRAADGPRAHRARLFTVAHPARRICRWCRDALEMMTVSPRKRSPRKAGNDARCRARRKNRFRKSALRDVRAGCVPHSSAHGPVDFASPRSPRERCFARDAAARCDGRRAPGEADRLHQAELREKRRASQTSARGKLPSKRVGENARPAATRGGITAASGKQQEANEPYRFEETSTTTLIAAVSVSALLVRP